MIEYKKGKYALQYERYLDDMGFEKDSFNIFDEDKRIHYPFFGVLKVSDRGLDFPIGKIPYEYTQEDFEQMLDEEIRKIENNA